MYNPAHFKQINGFTLFHLLSVGGSNVSVSVARFGFKVK